ncbi:MAG: hypothetical protein CM1200mP22_03200 [Dehalococcoidia bacterium]|nr:MAG: hypothetical protein CM1200mP22_03200 [Dehalococcoidia bacterium]
MAKNSDRNMLLVAFLQASNCSNYTGSWRHPDTDSAFMNLEFYQNIATTLERGKFHLAFVDDRLAMPSRFGDSFEGAVEHGIRVVKLDLVPIITAMGLATKHLGLGATYSTTYYSPYHVARLFASLDHFTQGRSAWNVVTSLNDSEAQNFGVQEHLDHDDRYDAADEFLQATAMLWESWEDNAVLLDKHTGKFADPDKVHRVDHTGDRFQVRGPLTVPRPPQGKPVAIQAASRNVDGVRCSMGRILFVIYPTPESCKAYRDDLRNRAESARENLLTRFALPLQFTW